MNLPAFRSAPFRKVRLGPRETLVERRADGSYLLRSPVALGAYPNKITERLLHWAEVAPDRVFIARRAANGEWRRFTYAQALGKVRAIGQALLNRNLSVERPVAILCENGLEHALLAFAAMYVGVPYAPISPAYSLVSNDHGKLKHTLNLFPPALVLVDNGRKFAPAVAAAVPPSAELVAVDAPSNERPTTLFDELLATVPTPAVEEAHRKVGPDTVAKLLFTSGSTGMPKGVINTQRMLCSNQQMILQALPFIADGPPVIVDWLPWNHTFGGNHNIGIILYNGGTYYIDDGKPNPVGIKQTIANLREIAPTVMFNVPRGFEEMVPYLRAEPELRRKYYSRLSMMLYAGAGLAQPVWDALDELAVEAYGERIMMITGLGSTETAPSSTFANWPGGRSGLLGLPVPGVELKLAPRLGKLEARFRGPNITPGYWRQPELNKDAFDEEGFYRIGDALKFADPDRPEEGLMFDGRMSEDFKLSTGTWVSVGGIREKVLHAGSPYIQDIVVAGADRDDIAIILFPRLDTARTLCPGLDADATHKQIAAHPGMAAWLAALLSILAAASTGSANRVARAIVADAPPSLDKGEITDKGSLNQRAILANRAAAVAELYAANPSPRVIVAGAPSK